MRASLPITCLDNYCLDDYTADMKNRLIPQNAQRRFDSLEQEAYLSLWRTYDRLRAVEDELFAHWELTPQQYNVLRLLKSDHPEPMATLTLMSRLVSRAPDITRMLDKLELRKLISRSKRKNDRRSVMINITAAGLVLLHEISEPLQAAHEKQLGHLSGADLKTLLKLLHAVRLPHETEGSPWRQ
ncbi:MAG TPA: MarR family winged helix-turn-helix transcriptional regulator [Gemmatales bacterium]|nr:MarR family winged helix-turn-helix transcriptional regulator [Gemmatales bacterium]